MTDNEKQEIINRLFSEYHYYEIDTFYYPKNRIFRANNIIWPDSKKMCFYIKVPSQQILYEANIAYNNIIKGLRFSDYPNRDTIIDVMRKHEVWCKQTRDSETDDDIDPVYYWTSEMDSQIEALGKNIEDIKIHLYKNADAHKQKIETIRRDLKSSQRKYNELYERKYTFDDRTIEYVASKIYARKLYGQTVYDINKKHVTGLPNEILDNIAKIVDYHRIRASQIREISHTSPWTSYYNTIKNPFTIEQVTSDSLSLMQFTRWYEWVRQHQDCPSDEVINDNDMIDGWYILKEREKPIQRDKLIEASDVNVESFVFAKTQGEADSIYQRNNKAATSIIYNRTKQLSESGPTPNHKLGDVAFDLGVRANNIGIAKVQSGSAVRR